MNYQERIYESYASVFRGQSRIFSESDVAGWTEAFRRYLGGWLPADRESRMLDLGCGDGRLLYLLKTLGYRRIRGIDVSAEQVALALQVTPDVIEGDVLEYLKDNGESWDVIFALDIVEHLGKDEAFRFLEGCSARLAPGGILVLSTPNAASPMFGFSRYGDFTHQICFSPECLRRTLALFGLTHVRFRETAPYPHGIRSAVRTLGWKILRLGLLAWNLIEVGHDGGGVFTRNFLARAIKPEKETGNEETLEEAAESRFAK